MNGLARRKRASKGIIIPAPVSNVPFCILLVSVSARRAARGAAVKRTGGGPGRAGGRRGRGRFGT